MRASLLSWFAANARALPWRQPAHRRDPYRVLVAEFMLQQTQVATAVPYYLHWLERFPDVHALAEADDDAVLHAWQGLGYYRRALNLRRAACAVVARHDGRLPSAREELERLPGVGRYTAAAVVALAYGQAAVAVDANVRRLASRLHGWQRPPPDPEVERAMLARLGQPAPGEAAALAEALIELGATVCTASAPACSRCPLARGCIAAERQAPERFPAPKPHRAVPERRRYALVALERGRVWLRRRPPGGLLGGLWGFPQVTGPPDGARSLEPVRHAYSHFRLVLVPVLLPPEHPALRGEPDVRSHVLTALDSLALSTVDRRVLAQLRASGLLAIPQSVDGTP